MDLHFAASIGVPLALFIIVVTALLYFWPWAPKPFLNKERKKIEILDIVKVSHDTKRFRLGLGHKDGLLGLPVGKHLQLFCPNPSSCLTSGTWNGRPDPDKSVRKPEAPKEIHRSYTPITGDETRGYVDLVVKIYRPMTVKMPDGKEVEWTDGGKMSMYLDSLVPGDKLDIQGPTGIIEYLGQGAFKMPGKTLVVKNVGMMAGGSGITPMLQIVKASLMDKSDSTKFSLIYANKTEDDILVKDLLDEAVKESNGRFTVTYTLDYPPSGWKGKTGFITQEMIKGSLPAPSKDVLVLMCGPPPMIEHACKKNLDALEYPKAQYMSF